MAEHQQTPREAALSALVNSLDGIFNILKMEGAAHVGTAIQIVRASVNALSAARDGNLNEFGANILEISDGLLNIELKGIPGLVKGLNDAGVAVFREIRGDGVGITSEEAETAGIGKITDDLEAYLSDSLREQSDANRLPSGSFQEFDRTLVDAAREAGSPTTITFEPEVITRRHHSPRSESKENTRSGGTVSISGGATLANGPLESDLAMGDTPNIEGMGSAPAGGRPALYELDIRTFQGGDRGFDLSQGRDSIAQASVTISPGTAAAGDVRSRTRLGDPSGPQATGKIEVQATNNGAAYDFRLTTPNATPNAANNVDIRAQVTITRQPGSITVSAAFAGDKSRGLEIVMRDAAGSSLFLYGHMPESGKVLTAIREHLHQPGGSLTMTAGVNQNGKLNGSLKATLKGPDGKVLSQYESQAQHGGKESAAVKDRLWSWNHMTMKNLTPPNMPSPGTTNKQHKVGPEKASQHAPIDRGR